MSKPKIVIFWGKPKGNLDSINPHPYSGIGTKKPVYDQLIFELSKSAEVFVGVGYEEYPSPLFFSKAYRYLAPDKFEQVEEGILADAVLDRAAKVNFPGPSTQENNKVLNAASFKQLCNNKWEFYKKFPAYSPKTRLAESEKQLALILSGLDDKSKYVIKPVKGLKGKGIAFGTSQKLADYHFEGPVLVQDFKETSDGLPGLVEGRHDLRLVVIDGVIVWATIRQPQGDGLLANVAKGGTIKEIKTSELPKSIFPIVSHLAQIFKTEYYNPLFSIDFGFENGKPFIYEINDQIGFPLPEMTENNFTESLAKLLLAKSRL